MIKIFCDICEQPARTVDYITDNDAYDTYKLDLCNNCMASAYILLLNTLRNNRMWGIIYKNHNDVLDLIEKDAEVRT